MQPIFRANNVRPHRDVIEIPPAVAAPAVQRRHPRFGQTDTAAIADVRMIAALPVGPIMNFLTATAPILLLVAIGGLLGGNGGLATVHGRHGDALVLHAVPPLG